MIIYQRSAGASFPFGMQVIFQTRMTRITRILKAALCLLHLIRMEKKRSASSASEKLLACRREILIRVRPSYPCRPRTNSPPLNYHLRRERRRSTKRNSLFSPSFYQRRHLFCFQHCQKYSHGVQIFIYINLRSLES